MQGTILILDDTATSRIMLKVQLSAACYRVVQGDRVAGLAELCRRTQPDLVLTAMRLRDGTARDVQAALAEDPVLSGIAVVAIAQQNDRAARLAALAAGIDEVLLQPVDDLLLQARLRSLLRQRAMRQDLTDEAGFDTGLAPMAAAGFAEPSAAFAGEIRIALVTPSPATGLRWRARLPIALQRGLRLFRPDNMQALLNDPVPDAIVIDLSGDAEHPGAASGLRLLAEMQARRATRDAVLIGLAGPDQPELCAEALDRGAHDVMSHGFCPDELALRIDTQLRRRARSDHLRAQLREGVRAALCDPMTGLHNRRYALPYLARLARRAAQTGTHFSIMLADLDHFKRVNDRYGHAAGDAVLVEAARRLDGALGADDLLARVGGEEFLIAVPGADAATAEAIADRLRRRINARPIDVPGAEAGIDVSISIGVVTVPPLTVPGGQGAHAPFRDPADDIAALIGRADRALYAAKHAGRNRIGLAENAA